MKTNTMRNRDSLRFQPKRNYHYKIDNYILSLSTDSKDFHPWKLKDPDGNIVLSALVRYYKESEFPSLNDIQAYVKKKGLGRKTLTQLIHHYGKLRSDHSGRTSDSAAKMWKSIGAKSLIFSDVGFGDSHYAMRVFNNRIINAVRRRKAL